MLTGDVGRGYIIVGMTKMMKQFAVIACLILLAAAGIILTGCETESASENNVSISPSAVSIKLNQSVEFTASGGYDYTWSLSKESWGVLAARAGDKTTYTSRYNPGTNSTASVQILTVSSTIGGQASAGNEGTNTTSSSYEQTAEAYVEHISVTDAPTASAVAVSPTSATVAHGGHQPFTASGGDGSYTWNISNAAYGQLTATTGSDTTYTATYLDPSSNTVFQTLTVGSDGNTASATITQTP